MMQLSEAAMATHGTVSGQDVPFTGVSTDSRTIVPGQLFVALRGESLCHGMAEHAESAGYDH